MNFRGLTYKNSSFYTRYYKLIAVAALITVAVIVGSLVVGDSVRTTLVKRVTERLGNTETIIFSQYSYLSDDILGVSRGVLLINGFVSVSGKLTPVMVWGVDDMDIKKGRAKINNALFNEIKSAQTQHIVLRLPSAGMAPMGSMFVTDVYTTSLRLELDTIISVEQGGNINLKNEQTIPFNIFVNRGELAETMDIFGKINVILSDQIISEDDFVSAWNYSFSGLNVETKNKITTITSDRIFIQDKVVETLCKDNPSANRMYTYLANSINFQLKIPYSFITAVDFYKGQRLKPDEIILSDYAAQRLKVGLGDSISISYFVSRQFKTLTEDSLFLKVSKIVPLKELQADKTLAADFPGLSGVERCTDWDSDLPINMDLITDEDERYWELYRNTPKAIIAYDAVVDDWGNAYGNATAIRIDNADADLSGLHAGMFGIQVIHPRDKGIYAAMNGVDFSGLFLALGFFIIISAGLLMIAPLSEMLYRRRHEIALLKALGYTKKRITRMLWVETAPVVLLSSFAGVIAGLIYTTLIMWLLGNVWKGATHTDGFRVYPDFMTIVIGMSAGLVFSMSLLYIRIVRALKKEPLNKHEGAKTKRHEKILSAKTLTWASIFYNRKQAMLSFITLAFGVLIVFSVGLNRRGFADSSQIRTATGGFALWVETAVPVYHNIQTAEGRAKLALNDLPEETSVVQLLKYSADDASCLNLNKVVTPNVLGIDMNKLKNRGICSLPSGELEGAIPALIDETVLQWSLGKKLGDTLVYVGEKGQQVYIQLAGTLQNSIFQGYILIDKTLFSEIWGEISGSEIMLVDVPGEKIAETKTLLSQALNNYGVRVMTTNERLKMFNSVTDTYLTIFLTLGGLGLLLGIFSFVIVVRKNLLARAKEITLYRSLGFDEKRIFNLLYKENIIIPVCAILTGALGSLPVASMGFGNVSMGIWALAGIFLAVFIFCVLWFVKISVKKQFKIKP